jgi:thiol-disulfide isomerase/thioredoxin
MLRRNLLLTAAAFVAAFATLPVARAEVKTGDSFPALASYGLVNLAGGDVPVLAGKVTLVDFWASWCAPCKASFPAMAKLHADYAPRGVQVVAISIDEKPAAAVAFWKKLAPPFTALHDREQKLVQEVGVPTMPTSYLVDHNGRVRFVHAGFRGDLAEVRKEIDALLAEKN